METFEGQPRDLDEGPGILESVWRYKWMIATVALIGALLGYGWEVRQPTLYEATSRLLMSTAGTTLPGDASQFPGDPKRFLHNQAEVIGSWPVLERAVKLSDSGTSPGTLGGHLTVTVLEDADVITISVRDPSPEGAASLANAVGTAYDRFVTDQSRKAAAEAVKELEVASSRLNRRLLEVEDALRAAPDDRSLQAEQRAIQEQLDATAKQSQSLATQARVGISRVQLQQGAAVPGVPVQPRPRRAAAAGLLLALMGSAALAWWLNSRRAAQQPERALWLSRSPASGDGSTRQGEAAAGNGARPGGLTSRVRRPGHVNRASSPGMVVGRQTSEAPGAGTGDGLMDLFLRIESTLGREPLGWYMQQLPQLMAEEVVMSVRCDMTVILLVNDRGSLEVAGSVGLIAEEQNTVVDQDHALLREALTEGVSVLQDSERLYAAAGGIPGSGTAEALVVVPMVQGSSWLGAVLVGRRSQNGHRTSSFSDNEIELAIRSAMEMAPVLQALRLLQELQAPLRLLDLPRTEPTEPAPDSG